MRNIFFRNGKKINIFNFFLLNIFSVLRVSHTNVQKRLVTHIMLYINYTQGITQNVHIPIISIYRPFLPLPGLLPPSSFLWLLFCHWFGYFVFFHSCDHTNIFCSITSAIVFSSFMMRPHPRPPSYSSSIIHLCW